MWTTENPPTTGIIDDKDYEKMKTKEKARAGGTWFEVKLIKSSDDRKFLDQLEVNTDGCIITPKKRVINPNIQRLERCKSLAEKKQVTSAKTAASLSNEEKILKSKSILSDESSDEGDHQNGDKSMKIIENVANEDHSIGDAAQMGSKMKTNRSRKRDSGSKKSSRLVSKAAGRRNKEYQNRVNDTHQEQSSEFVPEQFVEGTEQAAKHAGASEESLDEDEQMERQSRNLEDAMDIVDGMENSADNQNDESNGRNDLNASQHSVNGAEEPARYDDPDEDAERIEEVEEDENQGANREMTVESFDDEEEYRRSLVSDSRKKGMVMVLIFS
ncbi:hypothetical protein QAD02_002363 [Eretmocerus hayati]|uniref:Uncharacterized protein n=1 Tax=Eretmocerus hayati TaxID=131215 RepID=A0ACC2NLB1_9HYME|nr:hypothetical protein QAD02_002363 [Eretmocerus hayati]